MSDHLYDLAVVGAGPAGSLAAALAAKSGFSTLLLEQKSFPRPKVCGGFISARSLNLLPSDLELSGETSEPVYNLTVSGGKNSYSLASGKALGLLVKRDQFDHLLARYAVKNGAVLLEGFTLSGLHSAEDKNEGDKSYLLYKDNQKGPALKARHVIGADGALGRCGLLFGLRNNKSPKSGWAVASINETDPDPQNAGTLNFYPLPLIGGMGWKFYGPGWVNRGVGGLKKRKGLLKAYRILFPEVAKGPEPLCWPLPFLGPLKKAASANLMLIGDAAGLVEPFSGEGLYNSFKSATLAVKALAEAEYSGLAAGQIYGKLFKAHFHSNFALSLGGAINLHSRSVLAPSTMPPLFAALMENRLWFNRGPAF